MPTGRRHYTPPVFADRPGLVLPVRIDPKGQTGPTPAQARGRGWRRTSQGYYVPSSVDGGAVQQRILEATVVLPPYGVVTGWAGLAWMSARWFDGDDGHGRPLPVPVVAPNHQIRPQPGVVVSAERMAPGERFILDGVRLTAAVRSVGYEMRHAPDLRAAVRAFDLAAADDLVSLDEMRTFAATLNGWTGVRQLREALAYAEENAWSPAEVDMRLIWEIDLGLGHPRCNHPVFDLEGRHLGTPDLLDVEAGVAGEYDGPLHLQGQQRAKDLVREAVFRAVGLEYVTMVGADRSDPAAFMRRTMEARERGLRRAGRPRGWTIEPPTWWTPTTTVAMRRALSDWQRERFLRYRAS